MNSRSFFLGVLTAVAATAPLARAARSDLLPPDRRRAAVELAAKLGTPSEPAPLPAELVPPFNPPGFDRPDPDEPRPTPSGGAPSDSPEAAKPSSLREILETIASKIEPDGTVVVGGQPRLSLQRKFYRVGDKFTVNYDGADYELELVSIDRTTFTLRLRGEDITRPITPRKSK